MPVSVRRKLDSISTRLHGHKLMVYSIIWAEPAKAQAEAWQHHANFMDHTGGPRPEAISVEVEISEFDNESSFRRIDIGVVHFRTSPIQRDHSRSLKSIYRMGQLIWGCGTINIDVYST